MFGYVTLKIFSDFMHSQDKKIVLLTYFLIKVFNLTNLFIIADCSLFMRICMTLCDILTFYKIQDTNYLIYNAFTPVNIGSLENLLEIYDCIYTQSILDALNTVNFNSYHSSKALPELKKIKHFLSTNKNNNNNFYINYNISLFGTTNNYHKITLNAMWFLHLNMDKQWSAMVRNIYHVVFLTVRNIDPRLSLLLKPGVSFTNYLLYIIHSKYINAFYAVYLVWEYLVTNFRGGRVVGTNFIMWVSVVFSMMYIYDKKKVIKQ